MLVHTKTHHIKAPTAPTKVIRAVPEKEENVSWRESAKDLIDTYTEAGVMLRGARAKADLTQKELSEKLGIKPHHISEMEHGKRSIGKAMAKRLSDVLDIDYKVFL